MMRAPDVTGTVTTAGDEAPGDGAGMTYSVTGELPAGDLGYVAVPLANGQWAVPQGLPTQPARPYDATAFEELSARAQTFADAGTSLIWDASRPSPLTGQNVYSTTSSPYPVTCSSFVGMVVAGWDYEHTTYVADENTRVGRWVEFGKPIEEYRYLDANGLASWFYANGDLWLDTGESYQPGDILFFSKQGVGEQPTNGNRTYFGNVYHTAIYLGNGEVMHSTGADSGAGVYRARLSETLKADVSFVARPHWEGGQAVDQSVDQAVDQAANQDPVQSATTPADSADSADSAAAQPDPAGAASDPSAADSDALPVAVDGAQQPDRSETAAGRQDGSPGAEAADPGSHGEQRLPVTGFTGLGATALGVAVVSLVSGLVIIVRLRRRYSRV